MSVSELELPLKFNQSSGNFLSTLHQPLNEQLNKFVEEQGATQGADVLFAQIAAAVSPDEVNFEQFLARNPYSNPAQQKEAVEESAGRGWVTLTDTGFLAAQKSLNFTDKLVQKLVEYAANREADLDQGDVARAVGLLSRLVGSAQVVGLFAEKPTFTFSRNYEYEDTTPSLIWLRRHLITLGAYRDDCHIASWKDLDLPGYVWESFTFVWQDQAHTAAELAEQLTFRGFDEGIYAQALEKLASLGWVERKEGAYFITPQGRKQREQAELTTDQYYKAAFDVLTQDELNELVELIGKLAELLSPETEAQPE